MITVIGVFDDIDLAEEASSYLLANEFTGENIDLYTHNQAIDNDNRITNFFSHLIDDEKKATHFGSLAQQGTLVTVHALSAREAQEAVDALNNYGALEVNADDESSGKSQMIERIVADDKRLRTI
ncbi:hypothetical protein [Mucilaginibacter sp.]|uniref:hypothetical protein n=1 Tax=Mucilaginibacter sp. TaxID=1882438 RepID=UPI0035BC089F